MVLSLRPRIHPAQLVQKRTQGLVSDGRSLAVEQGNFSGRTNAKIQKAPLTLKMGRSVGCVVAAAGTSAAPIPKLLPAELPRAGAGLSTGGRRMGYSLPFRRGKVFQLPDEALLMRSEVGNSLPNLLALGRYPIYERHSVRFGDARGTNIARSRIPTGWIGRRVMLRRYWRH
jgi:hypothetical protein